MTDSVRSRRPSVAPPSITSTGRGENGPPPAPIPVGGPEVGRGRHAAPEPSVTAEAPRPAVPGFAMVDQTVPRTGGRHAAPISTPIPAWETPATSGQDHTQVIPTRTATSQPGGRIGSSGPGWQAGPSFPEPVVTPRRRTFEETPAVGGYDRGGGGWEPDRGSTSPDVSRDRPRRTGRIAALLGAGAVAGGVGAAWLLGAFDSSSVSIDPAYPGGGNDRGSSLTTPDQQPRTPGTTTTPSTSAPSTARTTAPVVPSAPRVTLPPLPGAVTQAPGTGGATAPTTSNPQTATPPTSEASSNDPGAGSGSGGSGGSAGAGAGSSSLPQIPVVPGVPGGSATGGNGGTSAAPGSAQDSQAQVAPTEMPASPLLPEPTDAPEAGSQS